MKKETLEEAAVINYKKIYEGEPLTQDIPIDAFKQGAKWQQERSYSEEEVKKIMALTWLKCSDNNAEDFLENRNEILKQFKYNGTNF